MMNEDEIVNIEHCNKQRELARLQLVMAIGNALFGKHEMLGLTKEYYICKATAALDALHGIAYVNLPEATEEMHIAVKKKRATDQALFRPSPWGEMFKLMAAAGDLTNGRKTQDG